MQTQVLDKIKQLKRDENDVAEPEDPKRQECYFKSPIASLEGQSQLITSIPDTNLIIACRRIQGKRDQKLYEAICYYRVFG